MDIPSPLDPAYELSPGEPAAQAGQPEESPRTGRESVTVRRRAEVPDPLRIRRYRRAPDLGPGLLFFSGGSALRATSRALTEYTHNSIHLITPFDSGGSSAKLRESFPMIGIGDLRNRLMALTVPELRGSAAVHRIFGHRFESSAAQKYLRQRLEGLVECREALVSDLPGPIRAIIRSYLSHFSREMPDSLNLRGACIGNLILAGAYLAHDRDIDAVLFLMSKMLDAKGTIRPVVDANLHLAAELSDGTRLVGQHLITSSHDEREAAIRELHLCTNLVDNAPASAGISHRTARLIDQAELICFPIGSFYTSVMACLLPDGVGRAVMQAGCPKVYVPNCGIDSESRDLSPASAVAALLRQLAKDVEQDSPVDTSRLLDFVLVDSRRGAYEGGLDIAAIEAHGVKVIDTQLVSSSSAPMVDAQRLSEALLSLV